MELQAQFEHIAHLISQAKQRAYQLVNTELINLYWSIGEYLHIQTMEADWGKSVVHQLADYLKKEQPNTKGFSVQNLWRMKQCYESYKDNTKLSTLLREIPWSQNMEIITQNISKQ